jgi:hypothetical protein
MKTFFIITSVLFGCAVHAQKSGDTVYTRCPIAITDTSGYNNYFTSHQPATIKVEKIKGDIVITIQQREQFYTMFFRAKKFSDRKYKIRVGAGDKDELDAKYSFRSGGRASYVNTTSGTVDIKFNKETQHWDLKVNGILSNLIERSVAYYKVKAEFSIE